VNEKEISRQEIVKKAEAISIQMNKGQIKCMIGGKIVVNLIQYYPWENLDQIFHVTLFGFRQLSLDNNMMITQASYRL